MPTELNLANDQPANDLLNHLPAFVFRYDYNAKTGHANFPYSNSGLGLFTGLSPADIANDAAPLFAKVHKDDLPLVSESMKKSAETMNEWTCEFRLTNASGKAIWMEGTGKPLKKENGIISGYGLITRSKDKMLALKKSEEKLQSLNELHSLINQFSSLLMQASVNELHQAIDTTLQGLGEYAQVDRVYIFEHDSIQDEVNNTFEWCAAGINPEIDSLQGIPFDAVPRWKEKFNANEHVYIPLVSEIADEYHIEKDILEPQGIISLLALPIYYGERFIGFIGFDSVRNKREWSADHIALLRLAGEIIAGSIYREQFEKDIIEARKIAEDANKAKSEFLANMSHEIRTPMNAILGFSEIMLNTTNDDKNKKYLNTILSSGRTLLSLINDILDLSKIEAGQMEIVEEPTRIHVVFNEIIQIFQARAAEKNLSLEMDIDPNFPEIVTLDDVRLRQILFNLVGNAIKFTQKGSVTVAAKSKPSEIDSRLVDIEIKVNDTGIGIDPAYHDMIFKSFYMIESDNTRKYGGTGLGLSITQKLVQIMGGTIRLESNPGQGSDFIICLKSVEISSHEPIKKSVFDWHADQVVFEKATILIVDDVDFNRELVKSFLSEFNLTIVEAINGKAGIEMAKTHQPDLVLMDLRMPVMNGYEATEILAARPETAKIPVIAFTASSMKHDEELIKKLFSDYLRKPIGRDELIHCLIRFLPHKLKQEDTETNKVPETDFSMAIKAYSREVLQGFILEFNNNLQQQLDALKSFMDVELLDEFLVALKALSEKHKIDLFEKNIYNLRLDAANFDFENFNNHIALLEQNILLLSNTVSE
jgi:signal transduction histidine kinase/DNA-binding response OmpR family regulator